MTLSQPLHPPHSLGVHTTLSTLPAADRAQALAKPVRNLLLRQPKRLTHRPESLTLGSRSHRAGEHPHIQAVNNNKTRGRA